MVDRYVRLSQQSDKLRRRLSLTIPSTSPLSPPLDYESPSPTPRRRSSSINFPVGFSEIPTWPTAPPSIDNSADEEHLLGINQQIKATLTELINCEDVKHDKKFRAWIQTKLMEAEHELKRQRKRKSGIDFDTMRAISEHLGSSPGFVYRATF